MGVSVDFETLVTGKLRDERKICSKKRKADEVIDDSVHFLLSPNNVHTYSWVTIAKDLSEDEHIVPPKIQCSTTITNLWLWYQ